MTLCFTVRSHRIFAHSTMAGSLTAVPRARPGVQATEFIRHRPSAARRPVGSGCVEEHTYSLGCRGHYKPGEEPNLGNQSSWVPRHHWLVLSLHTYSHFPGGRRQPQTSTVVVRAGYMPLISSPMLSVAAGVYSSTFSQRL